MAKQGSKRFGSKVGKRWACWRSKSQNTKALIRSIERTERQAAKKEIKISKGE